ncbi:MAG: 30S ribosomal protein S19 [Candidatus Brockarchaeota archaeon]|nr:30S ribosomal protein S19 [Candidatus Brockarchaeota archaeon]
MSKAIAYKGVPVEHLVEMPMDDVIKLLPSRARRSLKRGLTPQQRILLGKIREAKRIQQETGQQPELETHIRDMVILPEMVGLTIKVHSGREFGVVTITHEMIGHYLGEYVPTNKQVKHGAPGVGASRSSMYIEALFDLYRERSVKVSLDSSSIVPCYN